MTLSTSLVLIAGPALAHHPHDPVNLFDISSDFTNDQIALGTRYPAQNWRPLELVTSTDGAFTWQSLPAGLTNASEYVSFQLSPRFHLDGVAMMATLNEGVFVSTDGGASWAATLTDRNLDLGVVGHDGTDPVFLVHELSGPLWRSDDLGVSWVEVTAPPDVAALAAFEGYVALGNSNVVYSSTDAGLTWDAGQTLGGTITDVSVGPEGTTMAGSERGAFLSVAGAPFTRIDEFATKITTVGVSPSWPADPVLMASKELQGIWVSEDGGANWVLNPTGILPSDQSEIHYYDFRFSRDFTNDGTVFCNLWEGLAISYDRGRTWIESDTRPPGMITGIAISPNYADDHQVVVGSFDAGAWYTEDGGESWSVVNNGLTKSSTYDLSYRSDADGPRIMMGMRAHLAWGRPPLDSWEFADLPTDGYTTRVALSPHFATDGIALAATRVDGVLRTSDGGASWAFVTDKLSAIASIAWAENGVVLFGLKTGQLFRSDDDGANFVDVPQIPLASHPVFVATSADGFLVGTGRGLFTTDLNAQIYTPVSELPGAIHQVAASPDGTLFAALRGGGLYRSEGGAPFVEIGADLTAEGPPHELQVSPTFDRDNTLFAAIDERMYRS
ncbi:MAG TPA: hypothetical protein ENK18_08300, partial [Deltaproteobacteria bacterium]|nr:hypothetical protein [Deltaproteobacteria bacterium]